MATSAELFAEMGGKRVGVDKYPVIDAPVFETAEGTKYLRQPGVALVSAPKTEMETVRGFLEGFGDRINFGEYLDDPDKLTDTELLTKFAGQLCYMSFGPRRTKNNQAGRYFDNIKSSGHGSVMEHANFSVLWYGISRSVSHELVRHRAGMGYSQLSQRYVGGETLRFVERPEFASDPELHNQFETEIDRIAQQYQSISQALLGMQEDGAEILFGESVTDRRKKVRQTARAVLPNMTETALVVTGNLRAWRHVINVRANEHAEVEIREAAFRTYLCLVEFAPQLLGDIIPETLSDGTWAVKSAYPKV